MKSRRLIAPLVAFSIAAAAFAGYYLAFLVPQHAWSEAKDLNTSAAYDNYMSRYPDSDLTDSVLFLKERIRCQEEYSKFLVVRSFDYLGPIRHDIHLPLGSPGRSITIGLWVQKDDSIRYNLNFSPCSKVDTSMYGQNHPGLHVPTGIADPSSIGVYSDAVYRITGFVAERARLDIDTVAIFREGSDLLTRAKVLWKKDEDLPPEDDIRMQAIGALDVYYRYYSVGASRKDVSNSAGMLVVGSIEMVGSESP